MKRKQLFIFALFFVLLLTTMMSVISCNTDQKPKKFSEKDIIWVEDCIKHIDNPTFKSSQAFLTFVEDLKTSNRTDSILTSVPIPILMKMANVVFNRDGCITKRLILNEYDMYYDKVYKYDKTVKQTDTIDTLIINSLENE